MLILSRKAGQSIIIDGKTVVTVIRCDGEHVKVGIDAPAELSVYRTEVYKEVEKSNRNALTRGHPTVPRLSTQERGDEKSVAAP